MEEFIEKLIGRLEEIPKLQIKANGKLYRTISCDEVSNIVNQLVEEYKDKDCSKCSRRSWYQKGYADAEKNNGWIACSERLPSKEEIEEWATFLVTIRVRGKYNIMDFCLFGTDGKWLVSEDREVIAWKRQTPYQPKGE